jgi:hypothetical protein
LGQLDEPRGWAGIPLAEVEENEPDTADMIRRVVVSIEQFTSFRSFAWCPLGSLHRRLRAFDTGMSFQRAVEYLIENDCAAVREYPNPQSNYNTKGISLNMDNAIVRSILEERDVFIRMLLALYDRNLLISEQNLMTVDGAQDWNLPLWFSIMETENVLNSLPGRQGQYSLFRTHHTVNLVAGEESRERD